MRPAALVYLRDNMACERRRRRCFAMEVDPKYVDVAVQRWERFTGKKAEVQRP